ncbi:response regulator transcription factor [Leucobacter tardus]|uniref:Response regulator transcription factor n=1 Tax=Leucobacter tardus TaxID=501483 RepID=A0A939QD42_9MICO|nr:response regulator transcription factor [Leucobacter tardus]MBO2988953.1 response regulator transcription factor [Leucobacter tardus]
MSAAPIRVMLVDDQDLIRTGFRLVLSAESDIDVVGEATDGATALEVLARLDGACDVILMDVRMPGMNGIDASAEVARRFPQTKVLVLTTFDLDEYATAAIQAGASGFLLKDARPSELLDAIQRVADGDAVMAPSVTRRMLEQMRTGGGASELNGLAVAPASQIASAGTADEPGADLSEVLTEREIEVLKLIAEGKNNAEISGELFLSESTVKTHVGRILSKLALRDRVHAVIYARTHGL